MNDFLPADYKAPAGNYYKFKDGENTFRILSSAIIGWEYWNTEDEPVRSREQIKGVPADIKMDPKTGKPTAIKHFWAFVVTEDGVTPQILEITQKGIQSAIRSLVENPKWGNPTGYDITVTKTGSQLTTEYTVMPNPHSPAPAIDISHINLQALYSGDNPFGA